jgi:hypothetical protein
MMIEPGRVAIVRFPRDQLPMPAVALVHAYRHGQALVSKHSGPRRQGQWGWSKARWVPAVDVARVATEREIEIGHVIDALPPRERVA